MIKNTVVANGFHHLYSSIMVFDQENHDLLNPDSLEKDQLLKYFTKLMERSSFQSKYFCEDYKEISE